MHVNNLSPSLSLSVVMENTSLYKVGNNSKLEIGETHVEQRLNSNHMINLSITHTCICSGMLCGCRTEAAGLPGSCVVGRYS